MSPPPSSASAAARSGRSVPRRSRRLAVEIAVVLTVKFAALVAIWSVWFDDPQDHRVGGEDVARAIYAAPVSDSTGTTADAPRP